MAVQMAGYGNPLTVSSDGLTVSNPNPISGYKAARCNTTISAADIGSAGTISKRMFEIRVNYYSNPGDMYLGILDNSFGYSGSAVFGQSSLEYGYGSSGVKVTNYATYTYGDSFTIGDVVGILMEIPSPISSGLKLYFAKNGVIQGLAFTITNISTIAVACRFYYGGQNITYNFGENQNFSCPIVGWNNFLGDPIRGITNFDGIYSNDDLTSVRSSNSSVGNRIDDQQACIREVTTNEGLDFTQSLVSGDRFIRYYNGIYIPSASVGNRLTTNNIGSSVDDINPGNLSSLLIGNTVDNISMGERTRNYEGIEVGEIFAQSNADNLYLLNVNPTHQFRNQVVSVNFSTRTGINIYGKYKVTIGDTELIPYGTENSDISSGTFTISPGLLETGVNKCRIYLSYMNGVIEHLDFEILKEEAKRTVVERLFRDYDGGFSGDHICPPYIYAGSIAPCFMAPYDQSSTLIQTTESTRITLSKYLNIQGLNIVGDGLRILVSFDKGVTWKSFINNSWQTADISNIGTLGMTVTTINGITLAQWSDVFTPTSLDFAISIDNSASSHSLDSGQELLVLSTSGNSDLQSSSISPLLRITRMNMPSISGFRSDIQITSSVRGLLQYLQVATSFYFTANNDEIITRMQTTASTLTTYQVYAKSKRAYLKSINVQITPNPKTGYAFIM